MYVQLYLGVTFSCLQRVCNVLLHLLSLRAILQTHQQFTYVVEHVHFRIFQSIPYALTCIGTGHTAVAVQSATSACNMPKADNRQNSPDLKRQPHPFFVLQKATKALTRSCAMCRWTLACLEPWQGLFRVSVTLGAQKLLQRAPLQPWWVGTWTASGTSLAK